ncbi:MAG: tetratricopeptide repeat protein [Bacteroidales bacterium]|nr:tetratricopeptide repeat protein [Bacteroidales bacterium]
MEIKINKRDSFWLGGIIILTIIIYFPAFFNGFINWDDNWYITENPYIRNFSFNGIINIFSSFYGGQYSPFTMLVFSLMNSIFGMNPVPFHILSVLLHLINIFLVYKLIKLLFNNSLISIIVAGLFSINPLQVESVVWLSATKITLSSFFYLASLIAYINYIKKDYKSPYYFLALILFVFSILSKEQMIVLPLMLIVIDFTLKRNLLSSKVIIEKLPFLLTSLIFGIIILLASQSAKDIYVFNSSHPLILISFVFYAFVQYLVKLVLPVNQSCFYTFPDNIPMESWIVSFFVLLLIITIIFYVSKKSNETNYAIWLFIINLIMPLLTLLIMSRSVFMAERYVYLSSIGLFLLFALLIEKIKHIYLKAFFIIIFAGYALFCSFQTYNRIKIWKNSYTLWNDVIESVDNHYFPYLKRGNAFMSDGLYSQAMNNFNKSIELCPKCFHPYLSRGHVFLTINKYKEAINDFTNALHIDSISSYAYNNRGLAHIYLENYDLALQDLKKAIKIEPGYAYANKNLGTVYSYFNYPDSACYYYKKAINFGLLAKDEIELKETIELNCK